MKHAGVRALNWRRLFSGSLIWGYDDFSGIGRCQEVEKKMERDIYFGRNKLARILTFFFSFSAFQTVYSS